MNEVNIINFSENLESISLIQNNGVRRVIEF